MSGHSIGPQYPLVADDQRQVLAQLQRLYGHRSIAPDLFGRRPALPSEVERLIKNRQPPPDQPQSARTTQHRRQKRHG